MRLSVLKFTDLYVENIHKTEISSNLAIVCDLKLIFVFIKPKKSIV
jgi:hypothetical protein